MVLPASLPNCAGAPVYRDFSAGAPVCRLVHGPFSTSPRLPVESYDTQNCDALFCFPFFFVFFNFGQVGGSVTTR